MDLAGDALLCGIAVIVGDSISLGGQKFTGDIYAVISCLCTAAAFTIIRASGKNLMSSLGIGGLASALVALAWGGALPGLLPLTGWLWVTVSGLIVIPVANTLIANGPRFLPTTDVSMFFLLETSITPIWIYLLFHEVPSPNVLLGGMIVVITLLLHSAWRLKATLTEPQAKPAE